MLSMEGKSLKDELLKYFDFNNHTPSNSSFDQRRSQILPEAFEFLFHEFTDIFYKADSTYKGYRLLTCDGSDLCIAHNPKDEATYFQSIPNSKGHNQIHLNTPYDFCTRTYIDAIIQPERQQNEYHAMCEMIDRYLGLLNTIFIADRGYESYNIFVHTEQKGIDKAPSPPSDGRDQDIHEDIPEGVKTQKCSTSDQESGWFHKGEHTCFCIWHRDVLRPIWMDPWL